MFYPEMLKHLGHSFVIQEGSAVKNRKKLQLWCISCNEAIEETLEPQDVYYNEKPFSPFPKSSTKGGKVR